MTELLQEIVKLRQRVEKLRRQLYDMRRSRDMWKARAMRRGL